MAKEPVNRRHRKKELRRAKIQEEMRRQKARRMRRLAINGAVLGLVVAVVAFLIIRSNDEDSSDTTPDASDPAACVTTAAADDSPKRPSPPPEAKVDQSKTYTAVMETSKGTIEIQLDDELSPCTVNSFVSLAKQGFYDGLVFHRIVKDFALQGGDPKGDGSGGPGYKVVDAPPADFKYTEGVVAMAKAGQELPGTSGSQFFIVPGGGAASLPAEYAVLGRVTKGQDVVKLINEVPTTQGQSGENSQPLEQVKIVKVEIRES